MLTKGWGILLTCCLGASWACASANRRTPVVEAVEKALPSVVNIGTEHLVQIDYNDPSRRLRGRLFDQVLRDFLGVPAPPGYEYKPSLGSGIIIDPHGYILTNFHVVERATVIRVTLADEREFIGRVLAADEISDLALLKIDTPDLLRAVTLARNDDLYLGETVIVLGNPFGLAHTVTAGVLSGKNREARYQGEVLYRDILQTDAAVNPGSSGGPLLNVDGELIGINVAIYPEAQNIGFAVPVKRARALLAEWLAPRRLTKTWLGIVPSEQPDGLRVEEVDPDSPAAATPVQPGDRIEAVNGKAVGTVYEYYKALVGTYAGDRVALTLERDGKPVEAALTVAAVPKPSGRKLAARFLGLRFGMPAPPGQAGRRTFQKGLPIAEVMEDSPAATIGLRPGLLVTRINGYEISSIDDVGEALEHVRRGEMVSLVVVSVTERDNFIMAQSTSVRLRASGEKKER